MADNVTEKKPDALPPLLMQSSPHIASPVNSVHLMRNVLVALAPVTIFSVVIFGVPALLNIIVAVVAAVAGESLFRRAINRPVRVKDLSAIVTGVMLALVIPPSMPLWMTALGSLFSVIVAKEFFGGLGANTFNPALAGRAFLLMSFPAAMTTWHQPQDGFATALTDATSTASSLNPESLNPEASGEVASYLEMFLGFRAGSSGETSIMLIVAAFVFLLVTKTIDWRAPLSMLAAGFVMAFILGNDPIQAILSGGIVFGAVFMTTDYVSAPITPLGKVIFGIGAGIITMLIRQFGTYPEGVCYSILIMNCAVPFLNKLLPRKYGFVPKKPGREVAK